MTLHRDPNETWLAIDTCSSSARVLLRSAGEVYAVPLDARLSSRTLLTAIREILETAGCRLTDLRAVGVVTGPGSFTAIRVGLAAAKGLCEATSLPMVELSLPSDAGDLVALMVGELSRAHVDLSQIDGRYAIAERDLYQSTPDQE